MMINEDTQEEAKCPHCGSEVECEHLLACIDCTFNLCESGYAADHYDEIREKIESAFLKASKSKNSLKLVWKNPRWIELWELAEFTSDADGKHVKLDSYVLTSVTIDLLQDAGADSSGAIDDSGLPGFCSSITLLYAASPKKVFDNALKKLDRILGG